MINFISQLCQSYFFHDQLYFSALPIIFPKRETVDSPAAMFCSSPYIEFVSQANLIITPPAPLALLHSYISLMFLLYFCFSSVIFSGQMKQISSLPLLLLQCNIYCAATSVFFYPFDVFTALLSTVSDNNKLCFTSMNCIAPSGHWTMITSSALNCVNFQLQCRSYCAYTAVNYNAL